MTIDSLEKFEANGQNEASSDAAQSQPPVTAVWHIPDAEVMDELAIPPSQRRSRPHSPRSRIRSGAPRDRYHVGFRVAFVVGAAAGLVLLAAIAVVLSFAYDDRVLPGVHVGSVDLSGMTREEAMASLQSRYAYLSEGEVTITTPVGVTTITYRQAGRAPDAEVMADAAMAVGHSGSPIADAASVVHSAAFGQDIPVVIQVDPTAIAQRIRQLVGTSSIPAQDAQAASKAGDFSVTPAVPGHGLDEKAVGAAIVDQLTRVDAPADLQAGGTFVPLSPQISDQNVQDAIARAQKMKVDVILTWKTPPAAAPSSWVPQSWTIDAAQIGNWIDFGTRRDGTYAPSVDPAQVGAYLAGISSKISIPPIEPAVKWDASGSKPIGLTGGKNGVRLDLAATTAALSAYLDSLADGGRVQPSIEVVTGPVLPQITDVESVANMVVIGAWTTTFYPDVSNGYGANIRQPATNLNGQVIGPGQHFSFLGAVGPIDEAHGFTWGGVIVGGKSDHTGAMGGGICSASTTMFNAAATAGLQIDERYAHYYYINRYPIGRDATVYSNGSTTWDMKWTNDAPYPVVIRTGTTYGSTSTITIQIWSWPLNRTVTWTGGGMADIVEPHENPPEYVSSLPPGVTNRVEYPVRGFNTSVTRIVTNTTTGAGIHNDTWFSGYTAVNGQVQIGGSPPSSGTPLPPQSPIPSAPPPIPSAPPPIPSAPQPTPSAPPPIPSGGS